MQVKNDLRCLRQIKRCAVKAFILDNRHGHKTVGSFHSVVAWIECNWLHGRWVKAFIPDHIASQYRRFISFLCCLDRMQSCTSSTNLTICPIFGTYCTIGKNVTNQNECFWVFTWSLAKRLGILLTRWSSH